MTPGQRAEALVTSHEGVDAVRHGDAFALERLIAEAVREAEAAERERIGTVLLELACDGFNAEFTPDEWRQAIVTTAARIRESA